MRGFLLSILLFLGFIVISEASSILKVGELSNQFPEVSTNNKQLNPRKEGGIVMLSSDSMPQYVFLMDAEGNLERSLALDARHIDVLNLFPKSVEIAQLSSGNYILVSQNLDATSNSIIKQVILSPELEIVSTTYYQPGVSYRIIAGLYNSKEDTYVMLFNTVTGVKKLKVVKFKSDGSVVWSKEQNIPVSILAIQRTRFMAISDDNGYSYHTFIPGYVCTNLSSLNKYWFLSYVLDINGNVKNTFSRELSEYEYINNDYPTFHGCIQEDGLYKYSFVFYSPEKPFVKVHNIKLPGNLSPETFELDHIYGGTAFSYLNEEGDVITLGSKHIYERSVGDAALLEIIPLKDPSVKQISYHNLCRRLEGGWWISGFVEYLDGRKEDILIGLPQKDYSVSGKVFKDFSNDDELDGNEAQYKAQWVHFKSTFNYYSKIDANGYYLLRLGADNYDVSVKTDSDIWQLSENAENLELLEDVILNLPIQPKVICPEMSVNVTAPYLTLCEESTYEVNYKNSGSEIAQNVYVDIELDPHLRVQSTSIPYETLEDGRLRFDLNVVESDSAGKFFMNIYLDCENAILGQTHCVQAKIYPNASCVTPQECWDGSFIEIDGDCVNDTAIFRIQNIGEPSLQNRVMFVLEDDIMIGNPLEFPLDKNEIKVFEFAPNGKTIRVEVPQSICFPYKSLPSVVVEGCGGLHQTGLVRTLPQDDDARFVSYSCNESIDENTTILLKADPKGYGAKQFISDSTEIQYTFVFKNQSEPFAYLIDSTSDYLNLETFIINSSSHPYEFTLFNTGILKVEFQPVDSLSLGYFQYSITPKKGVKEGSVIEKTGVLYQKQPQPHFSNKVFHTIGYQFIEVGYVTSVEAWKNRISVNVYPNPFSQSFKIDIDGDKRDMILEVYSMQGQLIYRDDLAEKDIIQTEKWSTGQYVFRILKEDIPISTGKMIKH